MAVSAFSRTRHLRGNNSRLGAASGFPGESFNSDERFDVLAGHEGTYSGTWANWGYSAIRLIYRTLT